jgi:hypothetical protein
VTRNFGRERLDSSLPPEHLISDTNTPSFRSTLKYERESFFEFFSGSAELASGDL